MTTLILRLTMLATLTGLTACGTKTPLMLPPGPATPPLLDTIRTTVPPQPANPAPSQSTIPVTQNSPEAGDDSRTNER